MNGHAMQRNAKVWSVAIFNTFWYGFYGSLLLHGIPTCISSKLDIQIPLIKNKQQVGFMHCVQYNEIILHQLNIDTIKACCGYIVSKVQAE
jgi:hypothetical protein